MPSRPSTPAWQGTWLWKELERRVAQNCVHATEFVPTLTLWMRKLETVLRNGGTVPLDFTLHDAEHALRVAHRMEELIPESARENFSDYELALLLLAAYGHDVGMTPERGKVAAHHRHLFAPDQGTLDAGEIERFQKFLDEHSGQAVDIPISSSLDDLNLAEELVAYYVRDRHNDWSAEWLRESLRRDPDDGFGLLPNVVEVLVTLCSSHHWDFAALADNRFDPFTVGSGRDAQLIHLRYLACILRLADILENDPGRTPEVLFRHRGIAERGKSLVHWQKDHDLSIALNGDQLYFQARPRNARVHRALVQLADWIDHELHGIAAFGERMPAEFRGIKRHWHLTSALIRDIRPFDGSYEYIDGAFRPDTARLLQLLSGEQLYGNPLHAVRELLQNAFDAVREKIARKRLDLPDPGDRKWEEILGNQEHVTLTLRPNPDGGWQLVCEDSGVGLNKELITNHVLVSGTGRRHAIRQLERDCEEKGFRPGLTGQFGIGVLSYFMLADEVALETTRYQGCEGRSESWHFMTRGVGSFGELRRIDSVFPSGGTRVIWGLRKDRVQDPANPCYIGTLGMDLMSYLEEMLVRVPCRFSFRSDSDAGSGEEWSCDAGWVRSKGDWLSVMNSRIEDDKDAIVYFGPSGPYLSERQLADRERYEKDEREKLLVLQKCKELMKCELLEVELPRCVGIARIVLCYYELPEGNSLELKPGGSGYGPHRIHQETKVAWKGVKTRLNPGYESDQDARLHSEAYSIELDLVSVDLTAVSVSREGVVIDWDHVAHWTRSVRAGAEPWIDEMLSVRPPDYFHELNLSVQKRPLTLIEGCGWFHLDGESFRSLCRPVAIPLVNWQATWGSSGRFCSSIVDSTGLTVASIVGGGFNAEIVGGFEIKALQQKIGCRQMPCFYWSKDASATKPCAFGASFPPEWRDVGIVRTHVPVGAFLIREHHEAISFLNIGNPLICLLSLDQRLAVSERRLGSEGVWLLFDGASDAIEGVLALCAFAEEFMSFDDFRIPEGWEIYSKARADHLATLWSMISSATGVPYSDLRLIATSWRGEVLLTPSAVIVSRVSELQSSLLPLVTDPEFLLYESDHQG